MLRTTNCPVCGAPVDTTTDIACVGQLEVCIECGWENVLEE